MRDKSGDEARLRHILDAISEIQSYTKMSDLEEFTTNSMKKYATIKQLEIIGEAANHISDQTKRKILGSRMERNCWIEKYFDSRIFWC